MYKCLRCKAMKSSEFCYVCPEEKHIHCNNCIDDLRQYKDPIFEIEKYSDRNVINCYVCISYFFSEDLHDQCFYCKSKDDLIKVCRTHTSCKSCLSMPHKEILNCQFCLYLSKNYCVGCFKVENHSNLIINPSHPSHSYCSQCFTDKAGRLRDHSCIACNKAFRNESYNECPLCKNNRKNAGIKSCSTHKLCFQCMFLLDYSNREIYFTVINCNACKNMMKKLDLSEFKYRCRVCYEMTDENSRLTIMTCGSHVACSRCYKEPIFEAKEITCMKCAEFFEKQKTINCCFYCKKSKNDRIEISCRSHYICAACLSMINQKNYIAYVRGTSCYNCRFGLQIRVEGNLGIALNSNRVNSFRHAVTFKENQSRCENCDFPKEILKLCPNHRYCEACFKFKKASQQNRNCQTCNEIFETCCRNCFKPIASHSDRYQIPTCVYNHFYCSECFTLDSARLNPYYCIECKKAYDSFSKTSRNCIMCRKPTKNEHTVLCRDHNICLNCISLFSIQSLQTYLAIINCSFCKEILTSMFSNPPPNNYSNFNDSQATYTDLLSISNESQSAPNQNFFFQPDQVPFITYEDSLQYQIIPQIAKGICCASQWDLMECFHPKCETCIGFRFTQDFMEFLNRLNIKDLTWLKKKQFMISCPVQNCYNKMCIPFEYVNKIAIEILKLQRLNLGLIHTFALVFEGISPNFSICSNCQFVKVCTFVNYCIWCGF